MLFARVEMLDRGVVTLEAEPGYSVRNSKIMSPIYSFFNAGRACLFAAVLWGHAWAGPTNVGVTSREFEDPGRTNWAGTGARPVRVTIWYPAGTGTTRELVDCHGESVAVWRDAGLAGASQQRPLILISPGSGGRAADMIWLGYFLAERGYIAAAVDHNGTEAEELNRAGPTLTDFFGWGRAADLSLALIRLRDDSQFSAAVAPDRVAAAGFSLGGTTALWLAGARLDLDSLRRHSPPPPAALAEAIAERVRFAEADPRGQEAVKRAERSYRDDRIKAVVALAPPMGAGFLAEGLSDIGVPVCIVVGDEDRIAPAEANARHFAKHIPGARLVEVAGERGHYINPISPEQRRDEMQKVAELAFEFFEQTWTTKRSDERTPWNKN